jgi:toxin secretion/phage lysis holin
MNLQVVHAYLFGNVKYIDLLSLLMLLDIITGVLKAIKNKTLRSRTAWYGYARKIGVFIAIIAVNIIDVIMGLGGAVVYTTVLFYIANEALSVVENLSELGVKVPKIVMDKLHVMQNEKGDEKK